MPQSWISSPLPVAWKETTDVWCPWGPNKNDPSLFSPGLPHMAMLEGASVKLKGVISPDARKEVTSSYINPGLPQSASLEVASFLIR